MGTALMCDRSFLDWARRMSRGAGHGYPVAGGLSQSAVDDAAARTPLALVFCSITLSLCLLFFTDC